MKKAAQALWQDYLFLTKEMLKFLTKQDLELFYDLMNQRERLQTLIDQTAENGFKLSPEGQSLLSKIQQDNQAIILAMRVRLSSSKRQHQVLEAYDVVSTTAVSQINWNR
jgi:hypothetical protein